MCTSRVLPIGSARAHGPLQLQQRKVNKPYGSGGRCCGWGRTPPALERDREAIRSLIPHIHGCDRMHPCVARIAQTSQKELRGVQGGRG